MGMYDTFCLKIPIQCRNCYTGAFDDFQTKELDCLLEVFVEGEPAVSYYWRKLNEEEDKKRHEENLLFYPSIIGTPFENLFGMFANDREHPRKQLHDGVYWTYAYCHNCDEFTNVPMLVKDGIFVGVAPNMEESFH
jgi:hypothetical protein